MRSRTKKVLSVISLLCVLALAFSGCGSGEGTGGSTTADPDNSGTSASQGSVGDSKLNTEGFPIAKEKTTFSLFGAKNSIQGAWKDLKFFKIMEQKTNIAFEFDTPTWDVWNEKKNIVFAGGQYPDVFFGGALSPQEEVRYGSQGILIPLESLIDEYAPNIKKMFEEMPEVKSSVITPDGHIYALPLVNKVFCNETTWYNVEWLNALGVKEVPTTVEGMHDLLLRMKNEDPNGNGQKDEIPLSLCNKGATFGIQILPAFGILSQNFYIQDDKVHYGYLEKNYPEFIKFINTLWKEGLIDSEAFIQDQPKMISKTKDNKVGLVTISVPQLAYNITDLNLAKNYPLLPAMSSSKSGSRLAPMTTGIGRGAFSITSNCKNPEMLIRWIDYVYSEEGSMLVHFGEEGDLFKYLDNGLKQYIQPADGRSIEEYRGGTITPDCGTPVPKWVREENEIKWDDPFQQYRVDTIGSELRQYSQVPLPDMYFTNEEQLKIDPILADLDKYVKEMEVKFYVGAESAENYGKFAETIKKIGADDVIKVYQAAYDRWKENSSK